MIPEATYLTSPRPQDAVGLLMRIFKPVPNVQITVDPNYNNPDMAVAVARFQYPDGQPGRTTYNFTKEALAPGIMNHVTLACATFREYEDERFRLTTELGFLRGEEHVGSEYSAIDCRDKDGLMFVRLSFRRKRFAV